MFPSQSAGMSMKLSMAVATRLTIIWSGDASIE